MSKVIQIKEFLHLLNVKNLEECELVATEILNLPVYLQPGDSIETSSTKYTKLDDNLIHLETKLEERRLLDAMQTKLAIKIPV